MQTLRVNFGLGTIKEKDCTGITPLIRCRDFLTDTLYCIDTRSDINVYGFYFSSIKEEIKKEDLCVLISFIKEPNEKFLFWKNITYLYKIEQFFGIKHTFIHTTDMENVFCLIPDPFWFSHTIPLGLYTYILRCLCYTYTYNSNFWTSILNQTIKTKEWDGTFGEEPTKDSKHLINVQEKFKLAFLNFRMNAKKFNYDYVANKNTYTKHDMLGFFHYVEFNENKTIKKNNNICPEDVMPVM